MARPAGPYVDLCFHVLAHVAVPNDAPFAARAASLYNPRYVAWARENLPSGARQPIERDAALLGALLARDGAHCAQLLPILHDDIARFQRSVSLELDDLDDSAVTSSRLRDALACGSRELVELLRCAMALSAADFLRPYEDLMAPHEAVAARMLGHQLDLLAKALPPLALVDVRVSVTLGRRGRAYEGNVVMVGLDALPGDVMNLEPSALLVVHELAVVLASRISRRQGRSDAWARVERIAIEAERRALRNTPLQSGFVDWVSTLDLGGLEPVDADVDQLAEAVSATLRGTG